MINTQNIQTSKACFGQKVVIARHSSRLNQDPSVHVLRLSASFLSSLTSSPLRPVILLTAFGPEPSRRLSLITVLPDFLSFVPNSRVAPEPLFLRP